MDWKTMLAYVTGSVDENLLLRIEYLVAVLLTAVYSIVIDSGKSHPTRSDQGTRAVE